MASYEHTLADPPSKQRDRELWIQHTAGFIFFEDIRKYAIEQIDPSIKGKNRKAVLKGIDDAVYGLMMVIEGVSGSLKNDHHEVLVDFIARYQNREESFGGEISLEKNLREGDGMCMGFHGWLQGDYGKDPITLPSEDTE
jgi:hypothetical protein